MVFAEHNAALSQALAKRAIVSQDELARAGAAAHATGSKIEITLLELGIMPEDRLAAFLADWLNLPLLTVEQVSPHIESSWELEAEFLRKNVVCPAISEDGDAVLLMADPRDTDVLKVLVYTAGQDFRVAVATPRNIATAIDEATDANADKPDTAGVNARDIDQLAQSAAEGPIVRLVQAILLAAIDRSASDIHVETDARGGGVRLRVDGGLVQERRLSETEIKAMQSRLKIMAGLNISETRRPQDGRIRQTLRGVPVDFRLSTLPTQFGESLVLRVLDQNARPLELSELGFSRQRARRLDNMFRQTEGLFLVTGPTGSGKTTTLYTGLSRLNSEEIKVITIEDPIEYTLDGVCQTQIHPEIGYDFAQALRAVLRQDINVVLVGEIRDPETAQQAIRIAMTGRLVVSTLHTANALNAVDRLRDLEVPDYLLASTLRGVLSQRLVRRRGQPGRIAISELFEVSPESAELIANGARSHDLTHAARIDGYTTMLEEGERLVAEGLISETDLRSVLLGLAH